jgi:hypothetical protein
LSLADYQPDSKNRSVVAYVSQAIATHAILAEILDLGLLS